MTFLFTDIEGSTNLVRRLGEDVYAQLLADHHEIIRDSLKSYDGREVGTQGDSFFATFTSPTAGVAAALEMQHVLAGHAWPGEEHPRVRMGLHTGEASEASTGLVGYEVHRAARIAAVGSGGQILLSSAAAGLIEDSLPGDESLRNLGTHRLKDLGRPETLFQLEAPGLPNDFAPLRSLDNPELPNNLPASLNPFVGRLSEVAEINTLVQEHRLLTLTGAGGSGKTRLALQAAAEMLDGSGEGVWFVELAPISDPEMVATAIVEALHLRVQGELSTLDSLIHILRDQSVLLILDNCEHLVESVAEIADQIGRHCTKARLITTSREPLGVRGEEVYRVRSMSLPAADATSAAELEGFDAIDLFVARARSLNRTFELDDANAALAVAVCRRLDGIPLAIELAAARLSTMSLLDLHGRLDQRFRLLTGGSRNALPRQQTLGATVAWSYDLLSDPEREVLRRLSVFVNGFDLAAAESVATTATVDTLDIADILGSLVNKSLVTAEHASTNLRYRLLETIRQYAADQLLQVSAEGETLMVRRRHAEYYLALAEEAGHSLWGGPRQVEWMQKLSIEWDNVLAAFSFFDADEGGVENVLRLGVSLMMFLIMKLRREVIPYLESALAKDTDVTPSLRGWSLLSLAELKWVTDSVERDDLTYKFHESNQLFAEVEPLARSIEDATMLSYAVASQGVIAGFLGDRQGAVALIREAIALIEESGDENFLGHWKLYLAWQYPRGERGAILSEIAEHFRHTESPRGLGWVLSELAQESQYTGGAITETLRLAQESLAMTELLGDDLLLNTRLANLAIWTFMAGDADGGRLLARRSLTLCRRQGLSLLDTAGPLCVLAWCATSDGDLERGAQLIGVFDHLVDDLPIEIWNWSQPEQAVRDANIAQLIDGLGLVEYEHQREVGLQLSPDQVVNLARGRAV